MRGSDGPRWRRNSHGVRGAHRYIDRCCRARSCLTVGDLQDLVSSRLAAPRNDECVGRHVFYRLRRGITQVAGVPKAAVRLDAPLEAFFPSRVGRLRWGDLQDAVDLKLPGLTLSPWARSVGVV